jgi:hypothetical protein
MAVTIDGSASVTINSGAILGITSGTAVASTSGTSIDFTGLPSWVKRITVMFSDVSTNGTSLVQVQLGDSGGIETTGYVSSAATNGGEAASTTGLLVSYRSSATQSIRGSLVLTLLDAPTNLWVAQGGTVYASTASAQVLAGGKTLSGTLDRVRITTVNGTDIFDAGTINILYEG